jgi:phage gpG-like protein
MSDGPVSRLVSSSGGDDVGRSLRHLAQDLDRNRERVTLTILAVLQAQIVEELSTPGTGRQRSVRTTKKGGGKRTAKAIAKSQARAGRASAPGAPPAPDTGKLRGSIQIEYDRTVRRGRVGTNATQAAALNMGTTTAGKSRRVTILPRPFMEPALKKSETAMTAAGAHELRIMVQTRRRP